MRCIAVGSVISMGAFAAPAHVWEFRARFIERVGNTDTVLAGDVIDASDLDPRRIRVLLGVFDDAESVAPAGGFVGWTRGAISVSGTEDNSDESRTPGRLIGRGEGPIPPFGNGDPADDPFTSIANIDAMLSRQTPYWGFDQPMPPPSIRGRNSFISVYEITIDPHPGATDYTIAYSGDLIAATAWQIVGEPIPPSPPDIPGTVVYVPIPTPPIPFSATLRVVIPSPAAGLVMIGLLFPALARRRGCWAPATR